MKEINTSPNTVKLEQTSELNLNVDFGNIGKLRVNIQLQKDLMKHHKALIKKRKRSNGASKKRSP